LFDERERLLFGSYYDRVEGGKGASRKKKELPPRKPGEVRVGIPRMLQFWENFPYWRAFFESIGWTIVLSDRTTKAIIHKGSELVTGEFCFPIKVAHGHIDDLVDKDIDYVFLPSLINQLKSNDNFSNAYNCPYVQAMPYIIKSIIEFKDKNISILEPHLHFQKGRQSIEKELRRVLRPYRVSAVKIKTALDKAEESQEKFNTALLRIGENTIKKMKNGEYDRCLLIVGRSYNTCDDGLNLNIPKKLKDLGVLAIPMDCLPNEQTNMWQHFPNLYWKYGQRLIGCGEIMKQHDELFGVYITNFGCGPDSMIQHVFKETLGEKPHLQLEIDEHSADAGILTRCEAFLDSLDSIRGRKFKGIDIITPKHVSNDVKVFIPQMCNHAFPMSAALRSCGLDAEVLPKSTDESTEIGRQFTNGKECFPCIVTMGDIINKIRSPGFDPERSAFFMPTASGPCRFGQYKTINSIALRDVGYGNIPILSPSSETSYQDFGDIDKSFERKGWIGLVVTDIMEKLLREVRPYEMVKGKADEVFNETLRTVCKAFENGEDLVEIVEDYKQKMLSIPQKNGMPQVVIGMVGEIFLRLNHYSNSDIVRRLEELGAEVRLAPMAEWIFYTNNCRIFDHKEDKDLKKYLIAQLKNYVQTRDEHKYMHPLKDSLRYNYDPPVSKILKKSEAYLHRSFGGEAILSVGKAVDYYEQGAHGIVNVMPFTCMPGTVVTALSKKIREDLNNIPWLNLFFDGQQDEVSIRTRLETFVYQAREFQPVKR
ncbi:acyl-CoA dehydratase activase-related protein, partial [candidate division KSB1 bacterium]